MSNDKPTTFLAIKSLLSWVGELSPFLHIVIFFCAVLILYKCNYKLLVISLGYQRNHSLNIVMLKKLHILQDVL